MDDVEIFRRLCAEGLTGEVKLLTVDKLDLAADQRDLLDLLEKTPDENPDKGKLCGEVGRAILQSCEGSFDEVLYGRAILLLMKSYNLTKDAATFDLLYFISHQANEDFLRENYQRNLALAQASGADFPAYEDLDFILFPVTSHLICVYDRVEDCFWERNRIDMEREFFKSLLLFDASRQAELLTALESRRKHAKIASLRRQIEDLLELKKANPAVRDFIERYHALRPACELYEYFLGRYYFQCGDYKAAKVYAVSAVEKRRLNLQLNLFLAECMEKSQNYQGAMFLYFLMLYIVPKAVCSLDLSEPILRCAEGAKAISLEYYRQCLDTASKTESNARMAPWQRTLVEIDRAGLKKRDDVLYGRHLWLDDVENTFFIGLYNAYTIYDAQAKLMRASARDKLSFLFVSFDFMKSSLVKEVFLPQKDTAYIVPVAASKVDQVLLFDTGLKREPLALGQCEFNYFKIARDTKISSDADFAVGNPVVLRHDKSRKKLILNLFVDALSMGEMKRTNFIHMPQILRFFQKGVIFTNNYTPAEWTFPSIVAIQTGRFQGKTQLFHQSATIRLSDRIKTAAEYFSQQGYYCVNIMESNESIYNQQHRGYARVLVDAVPRAYVGVERLIQHLDAFDTDHYLSLHFADIHPYSNEDHALAIGVQTNLDLDERLTKKYGAKVKSVFIGPSELARAEYNQTLQNLDRSLGVLFRYIEEHYAEDEYIISLYSDHGVPIFSEKQYFFDEGQGCTAMMFRGAQVPKRGFVEDEITNTIDWYRVMLHLGGCEIEEPETEIDACLPRVFGGEGRTYTISNSLTPGQTYKLCVRTMTHEFRLETRGVTTYDGRIDMNHFTYQLFERNATWEEIHDAELVAYFLRIARKYTRDLHDEKYADY